VVTQVDGDTIRVKRKFPRCSASRKPDGDALRPYAGPQVGVAFLPEKGSGVWIEFGRRRRLISHLDGCYWRTGGSRRKPGGFEGHCHEESKLVTGRQLPKSTWSMPMKTVTLDSDGIAMERGGKNK